MNFTDGSPSCPQCGGPPTIGVSIIYGGINADSPGYPLSCDQMTEAYNAIAAAVEAADFPGRGVGMRVLANVNTAGNVTDFTNETLPINEITGGPPGDCWPFPAFTAGISVLLCPPTGPGGPGETNITRQRAKLYGQIVNCGDCGVLSVDYCAVAVTRTDGVYSLGGFPFPGTWFDCQPGTLELSSQPNLTVSLTSGTLAPYPASVEIDSAGGSGGGNIVMVNVWLGCTCDGGDGP